MELVKYPRQFLVSTVPTTNLSMWPNYKIDKFYIYHSPLLLFNYTTTQKNKLCALSFGYFYDPNNQSSTEEKILSSLLQTNSIERCAEIIKFLVGRFVIFIIKDGESYVFNDACGLRTVYYLNCGDEHVFGTQPLILGESIQLVGGRKVEIFFHSDYFREANEYWLPAGLSVYENINQLTPNHYLHVNAKKQVRFWPNRRIFRKDINTCLDEISNELEMGIRWAHNRFDLALPLTSGYDSRVLLAASKLIASDIYVFTRIHRSNLSKNHPDIVMPQKILTKLGLKHHLIINDPEKRQYDDERYKLNNSTSRFADSLTYFSKSASPLKGKVVMYGNISEIGKIRTENSCQSSINSFCDINLLPKKWLEISFIKDYVIRWTDDAKSIERIFDIPINVLFYWEHRLGNWAARAYNENDFLFDVFTPFNSRKILELLLSVDPIYRTSPNYVFYRELSTKLWPDVMKFPCNPETLTLKLERKLKITLKKVGITSLLSATINYLEN